jgi:RHS repeat-associated protein
MQRASVRLIHYKFTGKERDSESGLDNFGKRYSASSLGRFMTPNPPLLDHSDLNPPRSRPHACLPR